MKWPHPPGTKVEVRLCNSIFRGRTIGMPYRGPEGVKMIRIEWIVGAVPLHSVRVLPDATTQEPTR